MNRRRCPAEQVGHAATFLWVSALMAACGDYSLKAQGQECYASSECEDGLLCDFGVTPHVCSPTQTDASPVDAYVPPPPDAAPQIDSLPQPDGGQDIDASTAVDAGPGIDAVPAPDAAPPVDAQVPDAAPEIDAEVPDAA